MIDKIATSGEAAVQVIEAEEPGEDEDGHSGCNHDEAMKESHATGESHYDT